MTLNELREATKKQYPIGSAEILAQIEKLFFLKKFDSRDALEVGSRMIRLSKKYQKEPFIIIIREQDELPIFQYAGDSMSQRNINFAMKKRNTVLKTGHCSLWVMAHQQTYGGMGEYFQEDTECLPVGGAFPIYVNEDLAATIAVSGLKEGLDHQVIVDALADYFIQQLPLFPGKLV
nr:heme-binding protein [uncultured Clostridium sp.]